MPLEGQWGRGDAGVEGAFSLTQWKAVLVLRQRDCLYGQKGLLGVYVGAALCLGTVNC